MNRVIVILLYFTVSTSNVKTDEQFRSKRQDADRWTWGLLDVTTSETNQSNVRQQLTKPTATKAVPEYCNPYNPKKPDFSAPGRRISEAKCFEYIWELKKRIDVAVRKKQCSEYQKTKYSVALAADSRSIAAGGRSTEPGEFPHMGAIGWKAVTGTWIFKCGSSLISPKFVLTAGHCSSASLGDTSVADVVPKIIRLGDKNIINGFYKDIKISRIIVHPQYAAPKKYFDIALMELERKLEFTKYVQPACLWHSFSTTKLGKQATLTGWGVLVTGSASLSPTSPELQAADVDVIDSKQCGQLLRSSCNRNWCGIRDHQLCAGKLAGGVDACQGDSGGPLQVKIPLPTNSEGSMHYVIGVTSFGIGCALPNLPSIYTRVSSFIDWIEDNVWRNQ